MKKITTLVLGLRLLWAMTALGQPCPPHIEWQKSFGGSGDDILSAAFQLDDGGYILVGASRSPATSTGVESERTAPQLGGPTGSDGWAIRLGAQGNKVWEKAYGGSGSDGFSNARRTSDGNVLMVGSSTSSPTPQGASDCWAVKINLDGDVIWEKFFGGSSFEEFSDVAETPDGGFILGSLTFSPVSGDREAPAFGSDDYWIIKVNSNGQKDWDRAFGGNDRDDLRWVQRIASGGYLLGGSSRSPVSGNKQLGSLGGFDLWVVKVGEDGNYVEERVYGGAATDASYWRSMQQVPPGGGGDGFIMGGWKDPGPNGGRDFWLLRLEENLDVRWEKFYGGTSYDEARAVVTFNDGFLVGGSSFSPANSPNKNAALYGAGDVWAVRVDALGNKVWDQSFGGSADDSLASLLVTSDGGLLLAGSSSSGVSGNKSTPHFGGYDFWIIKLSPENETIPPTVLSALADCGHRKITVEFSEPMDSADVASLNHYVLREQGSGTPLGIDSVTLSPDGRTLCVIVSPLATLLAGTTYELTIISGLRDLCGNPLAADTKVTVECAGGIRGTKFRSREEINCTQDVPAEFGLPNWTIRLLDANNQLIDYRLTDGNGDYSFLVPPGTYRISEGTRPFWAPNGSCPDSQIVLVPSGETKTVDFANRRTVTFRRLCVSIHAFYPFPLRSPCCGQAIWFRIDYSNEGTTEENGRQLGLNVTGVAGLTFKLDSTDAPVVAMTPGPNTLRWGFTRPLRPGDHGSILVCGIVVEPCGLDSLVTANAAFNGLPPDEMCPEATFSRPKGCSQDPNDKQATPRGCGPQGRVPRGQEMTYLIEFQNTGTGPAYRVILRDTLDADLDLSTVEVLGSSHPNVFEVQGRELVWTFPEILLPAALTDEPRSHGYVRYRVRPRADGSVGTVITNQAAIYFDLNDPVLTAITINTLTDDPLPTAAFTVTPQSGSAGAVNDFTYTGTAGAQFLWNFGPGAVPETSTERNPAGVVLPTGGSQLVSLQVNLGDCAAEPAVRLVSTVVPSLHIEREGDQLVIIWTGDGYALEETAVLTLPVLWSPSTAQVTQSGPTYWVTLPATGASRFYRLREE